MIETCGLVKLITDVFEPEFLKKMPGCCIFGIMPCKQFFSLQIRKGMMDYSSRCF